MSIHDGTKPISHEVADAYDQYIHSLEEAKIFASSAMAVLSEGEFLVQVSLMKAKIKTADEKYANHVKLFRKASK